MMGLNPRDLKKMFKRMGVKAEIEDLSDATEIIIVHSDGRRSILESPQATLIKPGGAGQVMLSATGLLRVEQPEEEAEEEEAMVSEEDVQLVAQQTGVTPEEARQALIEAKGDLAEAIMKIEQRKTR
ncbi:MAG: NagC family transcriptional regulator [Desulfurococcales archaeon]|nr:NagC family transcriptional regulator [Desulfurococcales archaeon]